MRRWRARCSTGWRWNRRSDPLGELEAEPPERSRRRAQQVLQQSDLELGIRELQRVERRAREGQHTEGTSARTKAVRVEPSTIEGSPNVIPAASVQPMHPAIGHIREHAEPPLHQHKQLVRGLTAL